MNPPRLEDPRPGSWTLEQECAAVESIVWLFEHPPKPPPLTYEQRKELRICSCCAAPARPGQTKCDRHARAAVRYAADAAARGYPRDRATDERWNQQKRVNYKERRVRGRCVACGRQARGGCARCGKCLDKVREQRKNRKAGIANGGGRWRETT